MDYLNYHTDESNRFTSSNDGPWVQEYRKFDKMFIPIPTVWLFHLKDNTFILKESKS